jgi:hypothetical protein
MSRSLRGRVLLFGTLLVIAVTALAGPLAAPGRAVDGAPATSSTGQIRLYQDHFFLGGGTLVDRNWLLTSALPTDNPAEYGFGFGVVNIADGQMNVRQIDRIVSPPGGGGVSMLHFADPVAESMVMRHLATGPPARLAPVYVFGWGEPGENVGDILRMARVAVYDPVAEANAAERRRESNAFEQVFPPGVQPMVISLRAHLHDAGSGLFTPGGVLTAVNSTEAEYRRVNASGNFYGRSRWASYEQPVWVYRQWILDTINGAGSSGGTSSPSPSGRSLTGTSATRAGTTETGTTGDLPMTLPPQTGLCRPATGSCVDSDPGWKAGVLLGAGNYRGTAEVRCAAAAGNACSFDDAPTPAGTATRLPLGPASAPTAPGTREVMVWCKTTTPFPDAGSPAQPVLRVSLTNADPSETQPGYGWWDVTPGQIGTTPSATGQTQLDPATLPAC